MATLTVGELKKALEGLEDDLPVVMEGHDHSFDKVTMAYPADAEQCNGTLYVAYEGEELDGERVKVLVIQ